MKEELVSWKTSCLFELLSLQLHGDTEKSQEKPVHLGHFIKCHIKIKVSEVYV
jgi:hypothetical protein